MDEWEECDVEETVDPKVYQPNCMRCDEWGVGVDCIAVLSAKVVVDGRALQDWECLLDAVPRSVVNSSSIDHEDKWGKS